MSAPLDVEDIARRCQSDMHCQNDVFALADEVRRLRAALDAEKADHYQTMKRWVAIERGLQKRIAKARKALRVFASNAPVAAAKAYAALNWRSR